jgi:hypothetical protein
VGGAVGEADDAPEPLLDGEQSGGANLPRAARRLMQPLTGDIGHAIDDVRVRQDTRGDGAIGVRELQQVHPRRAERRADVGLQRGADPHLVRGPDHGVDADLLRDPHRDGVARLGQGLADRHRALELVVVIGDPLDAAVPERHPDRLVGHLGVEVHAGLERREVHERLHRGSRLT